MPEHESSDYEACDICGRSILRGESGVEFAMPDGNVRLVCSLCGERAESAGWVRLDLLDGPHPGAAGPKRGLLGRLRALVQGPDEEPPAPEPPQQPAEQAAPTEPDTPESRMRRAIDRFNEGEAPRLVAGLTRSLGAPRASVRELQGPPRVEVTIAWELSWYRWEIGQNGSGEPRQVAKGADVAELADDELEWNATVEEEGRLRWPGSS